MNPNSTIGVLVLTLWILGCVAPNSYEASGASMSGQDPERLEEAWQRFAARIAAQSAVVEQEGAPTSARERAEGYQYVARLITSHLDLWVKRGDPDDPLVFWVKDTWGLPSADAMYTNIPLRGDAVYELRGRRGTVHWLNFQATAGWFGTDTPMRVVSEVSGHELDVAADGSFTLVLGGEERDGNWLPLAPEASALTVRQFFYDWDEEQRAELEIRRLDDVSAPASRR